MIGIGIRIGNRARRVASENPNRLEYVEGGGIALTLFGLPFLAGGLFCIGLLVFRLIPHIFQAPLGLNQVVLILFGSVILIGNGALFTFAGAYMIFHRSGAIVDKIAGVLTTWRRLLWWQKSTVHPLSSFDQIGIRRFSSVRAGCNYCVLLTSTTESIDLVTSNSQHRIERIADEVATFLGIPML